jgi:flagellar hook assembly protein FlgD
MLIQYFKDETGIDDGEFPTVMALRQNAPNPFAGGTSVWYDIPREGLSATIEVFDVSGRLVRVLLDGPQSAGTRRALWDGRNEDGLPVASGVYYCRMRSGGFDQSIKMMLLR